MNTGVKRRALRAAFPHTIPVMTGYLFLGMIYGIFMRASGFSFIYPMLMSMSIFAGAMEFVTVNLLMGAFNPIQAFAMTLMVNARHLFYGLTMISCAVALMALYALQTGLLEQFGTAEGELFRWGMNIITGAVVCCSTMGMGVYMLVRGRKKN